MSEFDFSAIEEMDPSLADGYHIIYDREVPFEVRNQFENETVRQGTLENIKVKILMLGSEDAPTSLRLELSSEGDLFFHYMQVIDEISYRLIQDAQKLMVEFHEYSNVLIRMLNSCIRDPHIFLGIFTMHGDVRGSGKDIDARLDFIQNMEYKFVELMTCVFIRSSEEVVQHQITYRYNSMKQKLAILSSRLHEINNLVKTKNPSLLLQLQKSSIGNTNGNGNVSKSK